MRRQARPRRLDLVRGVIRQPFRLRHQQLVGHLPHFLRIAYRAHQRIMQHRLLQHRHIAMYRRFHSQLLHAHACRTGRRGCHGQVAQHRHIDAVLVDITGNLHHAASGQIRNISAIRHIEMPAVDAPGFQPLDDIRAVLQAAVGGADLGWFFLQPIGEIRLEPVAPLGADSQIAAGLAQYPAIQADPVRDLIGSLAIPRHVLAQMPVRLGRVITEAAQHIYAHLLLFAESRMRFKQFQQARNHIQAPPTHLHVPGLMIDAGADDIDIVARHSLVFGDPALAPRPKLNALGDLLVAMLNTVTQANGPHAAILVASPSIHRHRIRIIQEERAGLGHIADIAANVQQRRDRPLTVHDAARADRIADALIHAVL